MSICVPKNFTKYLNVQKGKMIKDNDGFRILYKEEGGMRKDQWGKKGKSAFIKDMKKESTLQ